MRDPQAEPSDLIRSVSRALRVLEAVGQSPRGLTVKQIARRCDLTVATTYHLVRTLAYEGYVIRREDGTYIVGLQIAERYRELVLAFRGPAAVGERLRRAAIETGYSHYLGRIINNRIAVVAGADGVRSPYLDDRVPGFDEAPHATALGKALLATMTVDQRWRYLKDSGMPPLTPATLTTQDALDADLATGERRGMYVEIGQYQAGVACAAVIVQNNRDPERRVVLACSLPAGDFITAGNLMRPRLSRVAHAIAEALHAEA